MEPTHPHVTHASDHRLVSNIVYSDDVVTLVVTTLRRTLAVGHLEVIEHFVGGQFEAVDGVVVTMSVELIAGHHHRHHRLVVGQWSTVVVIVILAQALNFGEALVDVVVAVVGHFVTVVVDVVVVVLLSVVVVLRTDLI